MNGGVGGAPLKVVREAKSPYECEPPKTDSRVSLDRLVYNELRDRLILLACLRVIVSV